MRVLQSVEINVNEEGESRLGLVLLGTDVGNRSGSAGQSNHPGLTAVGANGRPRGRTGSTGAVERLPARPLPSPSKLPAWSDSHRDCETARLAAGVCFGLAHERGRLAVPTWIPTGSSERREDARDLASRRAPPCQSGTCRRFRLSTRMTSNASRYRSRIPGHDRLSSHE